MKPGDAAARRVTSWPDLIGWCSLCLLSAAWGPVIPSAIRSVWGCFGLFGLLAGFALSNSERSRKHTDEDERRQRVLSTERQVARMKSFCARLENN